MLFRSLLNSKTVLHKLGKNQSFTITDESLQSFIETAKKSQGLKAEDIAEAILFAVQSPEHMNVNEILVRPTSQER